MNLKIKLLIFSISSACMFGITACKKDDNSPQPNNPSAATTTITGKITDNSGNPISGASISAGGKTSTSSNDGIFSVSGISADANGRIFVTGEKTGFFRGSKGMIAETNGISKLEIILNSNTPNFEGNTNSDNSFLSNGTGIEIPANSVSASGTFKAAVVHLNPADPDFERKVPGGDLIGMDVSNRERQLYSYGMLMVRLTDASGVEVNIASGKSATVRMKIPANQIAGAPASIPLWHFDESTGKWMEEGSATKQGDSYVGSVSHFSSWNCDFPTGRATVKGIIKDCNGNPMGGVNVRVGQNSIFTDVNGQYETFVPSGLGFDVAVEMPELGISSIPQPVAAVSEGASFTVPDISVPCVSGVSFGLLCSNGSIYSATYSIKWGNNQSVFGTWTSAGTQIVPVPSNGQAASYTITNALTGQVVTGSFTLPTQLDTLNQGQINLCNSSSTDSLITSFTINGDGYNNRVIRWAGIPITNTLIYYPSDTTGYLVSPSTIGYVLSASIPGLPISGLRSMANDDETNLVLGAPGGKTYIGDSLVLINVGQYGLPGEKVSGTFSGRLKRLEFDTINQVLKEFPVLISGGSFQVVRGQNQ